MFWLIYLTFVAELKPVRKLKEEEEEYQLLVKMPPSCDEEVAVYFETHNGKKILQYGDYTYKGTFRAKNGIRWGCATHKFCKAYVIVNDDDEIIHRKTKHDHEPAHKATLVHEEGSGKYSYVTIPLIIYPFHANRYMPAEVVTSLSF